MLIAGGILTLAFGSWLAFGILTGKMPTPVVGGTDAYRDEQPGKFWTLAALNVFGLVAGVSLVIRAVLGGS
jgi:hypothetical protein